MEIKAATKFLGNSEFKQLCHITSELFEIWMAWILYRLFGRGKKDDIACECIDLQGSVQTMLEGSLEYDMWYINNLRLSVNQKNADRGYDKPKATS